MGPWWEAYAPQREALDAQLVGSVRPEAAMEAAERAVDGTLDAYLGKESGLEVREAALYSANLLRQALPLLRVTPEIRPKSARFPKADPVYAPLLLSAVLIGYLFLNGQLWPALLSAVITVLWMLMLLRIRSARQPAQLGEQIARKGFLRTLDTLMLEVDRYLDRVRQTQEQAASRLPELDAEVLETVQMLAEAQRAGDGEYALKALPGLFAALLRKEVRMADFTPERAVDFDLFPSVAGTRTIRPALYLGETLVLRGQATQRVEGPALWEEDHATKAER